MKHSTGKPTKAQQERLDAIHAMPCIACVKEAGFARKRGETPMGQPSRTEAHHLVDKGCRIHSGGHDATIPLCGWHHEGILVYPLSGREMRDLYGPSLKKHKRDFIPQYGSERELLTEVDEQLNRGVAA